MLKTGKQEKLIAQLFKDTFIVFVVSTLSATIGNLIDGILISNFLGIEAIAAFGLTIPYQKFTAMLPAIIALGMQVLCSKSLGSGNLREANQIFSLALCLPAMALGVVFMPLMQLDCDR